MTMAREESDAPVAVPVKEARYESEARKPPLRHLPDLEHPWLGLESFREETRSYFFGRATEIQELHLRLRSHPLLVLLRPKRFGKN